ncbi:alpha-galactosidase [Marinilongibacter aquaticus]|uniref:alpha-galactosidase n=1 Tax=Marinilongibacter aquaticus TaxID=2975157 RepID=UPI0021BD6556|nr:alpha-galactosidase [Marinilongibacter aquaticus]UBM59142.1 alpha-galactosidase [Marinilongibacter aquaticus]
MKTHRSLYLICAFLCLSQILHASDFTFKYKTASAVFKENILTVATGKVERKWKWTGQGLVTIGLKNQKTQKEWKNTSSNVGADWAYYGLIDNTKGELISITPSHANDEGFSSDYLEVSAIVYYASAETYVKYTIWAFPDAPGLRTQVFFKGPAEKYFKEPIQNKANSVQIAQVSGKKQNPYAAQALAYHTVASQSYDPKSLQFHVTGLSIEKEYQLGILCWDWDEKGRSYQIRATSVDGERKATLTDVQDMQKTPTWQFIDLPVNRLATDGTVRIFLDNTREKGDVRISEMLILEKGKEKANTQNIDSERLLKISNLLPKGYKIAQYLDNGVNQSNEETIPTGRVDYLPINFLNQTIKLSGYYNDTQHRNMVQTPIFKEENTTTAEPINKYNWANIVEIHDGKNGLVMLKESHKCVNQYGVDTGDFSLSEKGISNTGTSLYPADIDGKEYHWAWASWVILFDGEESEKQLAIKTFDRLRYPTRIDRDMYTLVCTWGMSKNHRDGQDAASETSVLKYLHDGKELGVDLVLIDDGWQVARNHDSSTPKKENGWNPHPDIYPQAWTNVKATADSLEMKTGLWGIARGMDTEDMIRNWDKLKMTQMKLDFATFPDNKSLDVMMKKVREFIKHTDFKSSISWDLTENAPRYGYYWAREYGNVHVMNRKNGAPINVTYVPSLALRDFWYISRYTNLNKFQLTIHNPEIIDREMSDAYLYTPAYCVATTLFGIPQFFASPESYSASAKQEISHLLDTYKQHRTQIWNAQIFPIGESPSNASYTGFQAVEKQQNKGFLLLFREVHNTENEGHFQLHFAKGKSIEIEDLLSGEKTRLPLSKTGELAFSMREAGNYKFLKYRILK